MHLFDMEKDGHLSCSYYIRMLATVLMVFMVCLSSIHILLIIYLIMINLINLNFGISKSGR